MTWSSWDPFRRVRLCVVCFRPTDWLFAGLVLAGDGMDARTMPCCRGACCEKMNAMWTEMCRRQVGPPHLM